MPPPAPPQGYSAAHGFYAAEKRHWAGKAYQRVIEVMPLYFAVFREISGQARGKQVAVSDLCIRDFLLTY